jgi:Mg2+ and Co2+ transporter CorA
MYKSVTIRDSRQSLELNASVWRLSWVTFVFLPMTFLVGFFGMNVDTFENNPSIKWYFVAMGPLVKLLPGLSFEGLLI